MNDLSRLVKPFVAELVGTFLLALVVGVGVRGSLVDPTNFGLLYLPLAIGSMLGLMVYVIGSVSGSHLNPSVTVAMWVYKKIQWQKAISYLIAQGLGAWLGADLIGKWLVDGSPISVSTTTAAPAVFAEFLGAALLVWTVMNVVIGKINASVSGLAIGLALTLGITLSMHASGGIVNPAIALALHADNLTYLLMPLLGGLVGGGLALWLGSGDGKK